MNECKLVGGVDNIVNKMKAEMGNGGEFNNIEMIIRRV